jgi:TolB-like protein
VEVLDLLLERPGRVVTREELHQKLWPKTTFVDFEHGLNDAVKRLRVALGDSADKPRFVETVPRRGYRFIYPVEGAVPLASSVPVQRRWKQTLLLVALPVLLAALLVLNVGGLRQRLFGPAPKPITSIAVLPLQNLSDDPEQEYFADGMTDALIGELAQISALRVISRQSVMRYKGTDKPLPEIAREMNVDAVVEGSVLRAGERIRVTAQLIEAKPEQHLWGESFDRDLVDVLALHSDVARAIAGKIRIAVTPEEQTRLASARPVNPVAYEAYLKGRYEEAITHDPSFAAAYAQLAIARLDGAIYDEALTREGIETARAEARATAAKAVALDDSSSEAHATLGWLAFWRLDWKSAESEFRRAIELDPSKPGHHHGYGYYLMARGRIGEATAELRRAQELDPLSAGWHVAIHAPFYRTGRYDEAIAELQKGLAMNPNMPGALLQLGKNYMKKGMSEEGLATFQKAMDLYVDRWGEPDPEYLAYLVWGYAGSGRKSEALKVLEEMTAVAKRRYVFPMHFVTAYVGLGEKDMALLWLERAYEERSADVGWLTTLANRVYDPLRADPRFKSVLRRMNLPE